MTTYAKLDLADAVESLVDLDAEEYAGMQINGKALRLRLWVPTAPPAPSATQVVEPALPVVDAVNATQAWTLRSKTSEELEADAIQAEKIQLTQYITDIQTQLDISNAAFSALTTAQKFDVLRDDRRAALRALKLLLRQLKRSL
jgi:hypothetical protein